MPDDFIAPPLGWSLLSTLGGLATAIILIVGIESLSSQLKQKDLPSLPSETEQSTSQAR